MQMPILPRRSVIAMLGGAVAWPLTARAQRPQPVPLVGAIWAGGNASAPIIVRVREAFQRGLREDGYVEGRNITIEHRYGASPSEFHKAAEELVQLDPRRDRGRQHPRCSRRKASDQRDPDSRREYG